MKGRIRYILFALTVVLLFASMTQKWFNLPRFRALEGVVVEAPKPKLNLQNYCSGSYQTQTEQYLKQHFGYREPLIRLYNQYLWDFYDKTPVTGGQIVFGKDGWIYEPWVVNDHYKIHFRTHASSVEEMTKRLAEEAKRVYQLQHILDTYDTELVVCLVPSKDMIYPEYLPENKDTRFEGEEKMSAREYLKETYHNMDVNFLDLEDYFLQMKDTADFLLFPQTGTHWSKYASLYAADTMIRYMEHLNGINMPNLVIGPRTLQDADGADIDLESLLNLVRPLPKSQCCYASVTTDNDTAAIKPRMILIGDSFWWNVVKQLPMQDIFSAYPYWYYNSSIYFDEKHHSVDAVDLVEEILSSDFINLFYSSTQLYKMNNGFTKKALFALCYDPEEIALVENSLTDAIHADSSWMARLQEKTKTNSKSIDEVVHDEVQWLIDHNTEKYFPALRDSIPTKRSKHAEAFYGLDSLAFIEQEVEKTIQSIMADDNQMISIREKAAAKSKTIEQALRDDAHWVVNYKLEHGTLQIPEIVRKKRTNQHGHGIQQ